jgi:uncharacterized protein
VIRYSQQGDNLTFAVRIVPRASLNEIVGEIGGALKVRVAAPPVEGAANRELIRLLAKRFKLSKDAVEIVAGKASKNKIVRLRGISPQDLEQLI